MSGEQEGFCHLPLATRHFPTMKQTIVLTGFMGTGKTTVGRLLAARTGRVFVDTDELIVWRAGKSIADIFADEGELAFRSYEAAVAQELSGRDGLVIATGGRLMLDPDNAQALSHNNQVICLTASPEEILARIQADGPRRPLLAVDDPAGQIQRLLTKRATFYGQFRQLSSSGRSPAELCAAIADAQPFSPILDQTIAVSHPAGQYPILLGRHLLPHLAHFAALKPPFAVITDSQVGPLYAGLLPEAACVVTLPAGEQHKTLGSVRTIYDQLLAAGLDRTATLVALGGGVVGDITGFVAATFLRGVNFIQCPTTLLAMVDASIGGKVGVDLPQGKNLVGAFKQPSAVIADLTTLNTLSPTQFAAGLAEVVKSGLIADPSILAWFEEAAGTLPQALFEPTLADLIAKTIAVKQHIVEADPYEQGRRAVLNLGHTFGHAIEQVSDYEVGHGQAVAIGLVAAARLSAQLGYCSPLLVAELVAILQKLGLPVTVPAGLHPQQLLQAMSRDKKRTAGQHRLILLRQAGDVFLAEVPEATIFQFLLALTTGTRSGEVIRDDDRPDKIEQNDFAGLAP